MKNFKLSLLAIALSLGVGASVNAETIDAIEAKSLIGSVPSKMSRKVNDDMAFVISWGGDVPTILAAEEHEKKLVLSLSLIHI